MRPVALALLAAVGLAMAFVRLAPREPVDLAARGPEVPEAAGIDPWLEAREAGVAGLVPGVEKRVLWAGAPGQVTDWAVVYVHGFSATSEEIRPVPDEVARALGANLYFARLAGHGMDPAAMGEVTVADWMRDTSEALTIGQRIGRRTLILATSTGGTLVAEALRDPGLARQAAGVVMISPNFRVNSVAASLLTWPGVRTWGPWIAGRERCFDAVNAAHARYWTTCYPFEAVLPMAALVARAAADDYGSVAVPALVLVSSDDQVVDPATTRRVMAGWGAPVRIEEVQVAPGDDPYHHVLAGAVLSPSGIAPAVRATLDWVGLLPSGG